MLYCTIGVGIILCVVADTNVATRSPTTTSAYTYRIFTDVYNAFIIEATTMHLCGLALDRYFALFRPYSYNAIVTPKRMLRYITFSWCFPLLASAVQLCWLYKVIAGRHSNKDMMEIAKFDIWYSVGSFIAFLAVPMALVSIVYIAMFIKTKHIISSLEAESPSFLRRYSDDIRIAYTFALMYVCFIILVTPYFSLRLVMDFNAVTEDTKLSFGPVTCKVLQTVGDVTSVINPLLYTGRRPDIQAMFKRFFVRHPALERVSFSTRASSVHLHSRREPADVRMGSPCQVSDEYLMSVLLEYRERMTDDAVKTICDSSIN